MPQPDQHPAESDDTEESDATAATSANPDIRTPGDNSEPTSDDPTEEGGSEDEQESDEADSVETQEEPKSGSSKEDTAPNPAEGSDTSTGTATGDESAANSTEGNATQKPAEESSDDPKASQDGQAAEDEGDNESGEEEVGTDDGIDLQPTGESAAALQFTISAGKLRENLDLLLAIDDECKLHCGSNGIQTRVVDHANVSMVDLTMPADAFEHYETQGRTIGVDLSRLEDITSMVDSDTLVQAELDLETMLLHLQLDQLEYTLATIDPDSIRGEPDIPELELPTTAELEIGQVQQAVRAADMVADTVNVTCTPGEDALSFDASGDTDEVSQALTADDIESLQAGKADSLFAVEYLKSLSNALPKSTMVTMRLGEEFPMEMEFSTQGSKTTYLLAPRIQSD